MQQILVWPISRGWRFLQRCLQGVEWLLLGRPSSSPSAHQTLTQSWLCWRVQRWRAQAARSSARRETMARSQKLPRVPPQQAMAPRRSELDDCHCHETLRLGERNSRAPQSYRGDLAVHHWQRCLPAPEGRHLACMIRLASCSQDSTAVPPPCHPALANISHAVQTSSASDGLIRRAGD